MEGQGEEQKDDRTIAIRAGFLTCLSDVPPKDSRWVHTKQLDMMSVYDQCYLMSRGSFRLSYYKGDL